MISPDLILALVGVGGITSVLTAGLNGLFQKRRLSADATKIITEAAAGVTELARADNHELRERLEHLERAFALERKSWENERTDWRSVLQLHAAWDSMAVAHLQQIDMKVALPAPPPLYPPPVVGLASAREQE